MDYLTTHTSLSPIWCGFVPGFVNYKKRCTRLATTSDKVYQLLAHGLWFSPGTPASSITKTGRHDIAEILLKVALKHQKSNQIHTCVSYYFLFLFFLYFIAYIVLSYQHEFPAQHIRYVTTRVFSRYYLRLYN